MYVCIHVCALDESEISTRPWCDSDAKETGRRKRRDKTGDFLTGSGGVRGVQCDGSNSAGFRFYGVRDLSAGDTRPGIDRVSTVSIPGICGRTVCLFGRSPVTALGEFRNGICSLTAVFFSGRINGKTFRRRTAALASHSTTRGHTGASAP